MSLSLLLSITVGWAEVLKVSNRLNNKNRTKTRLFKEREIQLKDTKLITNSTSYNDEHYFALYYKCNTLNVKTISDNTISWPNVLKYKLKTAFKLAIYLQISLISLSLALNQ